jgi:hypothetical protein
MRLQDATGAALSPLTEAPAQAPPTRLGCLFIAVTRLSHEALGAACRRLLHAIRSAEHHRNLPLQVPNSRSREIRIT